MSRSLLDWAVLAVSFFNTISLLWLGIMVGLAGNRRSPGAWLTGGGLLLGALFFTSHTAILGRGLGSASLGMNFWWWVSWAPAVAAPLAWYGALLWYAGYRFGRPHTHRFWVALVLGLAGSIGLLLVFANPLPSYEYVAGSRLVLQTPSLAGVPLLILVYLLYALLCYLLPLDLLRLPRGETGLPARTRERARPWLMAASLALLLAGILLAWTALWAVTPRPLPSLDDPVAQQTVLRFDLAVSGMVALAITLLGRAIVGFEVFTGRPLPRNHFFRQWRSTVILAGGFGAAAAWTLTIELKPLYSLMLATMLMTLFYALYNWRALAEREAFMDRLRPFVASQDLYGQLSTPGGLTGNDGSLPGGAPDAGRLFESLCRDVLEVEQATLIPAGALATLAGPPLVYPPGAQPHPADLSAWPTSDPGRPGCLPGSAVLAGPGIDWAVPLWSSRGLDGALLLGPKKNGNPFTDEEIEIAQAAGERLLDLLAGAEMARLAMDLLRQRLAQARVLEGQGRRVLHDEVLPELHAALLYLSEVPASAGEQQAMDALANAHRRIADLMREMPLPAPHRLAQQGLAAALRAMVEIDFAHDFDGVHWEIQPDAARACRALPLFVGEALYYAARELVRNAAMHGRGERAGAPLALTIGLSLDRELRLVVEDNGVGYHLDGDRGEAGAGRRAGTGTGLRMHSAMLAAAGARLEINTAPGGGTRGLITAKPLLVAQGLDRLEVGGPVGGIDAKEEPHGSGKERGEQDGVQTDYRV
jgi:signal transduction histidine kinase